LGPRVDRVSHSIRDYSQAIASASGEERLAAVGEALLRGAATVMSAREAAAWIPADSLAGPPIATWPADLRPSRIAKCRRAARLLISGRAVREQHVAVAASRGAASPQAVFVFMRRPKEPLSGAERRLLARLSPLLAVAVSAASAPHDGPGAVRAPDPSRATLDLLATLAHEMRTPLAMIKGYATSLLVESQPWDQARMKQVIEIVDQETATLTTLISELLEAAAIDGGRLVVEPEPVLLNRLLERLAAEFRDHFRRHRFILAFPGRWPAIDADPRRLEQVFRNIMDNAVKYSPHGGQITVSGATGRNEVVVSIADQGIGIAPADLNRLFEKFFRARRSVRVAGSGLGLPIAHAIVERHGGRIWAESTPGRGTTMHVALPRRAKKRNGR
jgi:signal transduction histidine kinase